MGIGAGNQATFDSEDDQVVCNRSKPTLLNYIPRLDRLASKQFLVN